MNTDGTLNPGDPNIVGAGSNMSRAARPGSDAQTSTPLWTGSSRRAPSTPARHVARYRHAHHDRGPRRGHGRAGGLRPLGGLPVAFASLTPAGAEGSSLYVIDLLTGGATLVALSMGACSSGTSRVQRGAAPRRPRPRRGGRDRSRHDDVGWSARGAPAFPVDLRGALVPPRSACGRDAPPACAGWPRWRAGPRLVQRMPAWPGTLCQAMSRVFTSARSASQRSRFSTGFFWAFFQPFSSQRSYHFSRKQLMT